MTAAICGIILSGQFSVQTFSTLPWGSGRVSSQSKGRGGCHLAILIFFLIQIQIYWCYMYFKLHVYVTGKQAWTRGKPTEASMDWKPNAHKCRDRESNPGLIGAKRGKIRYANLLQFFSIGKFYVFFTPFQTLTWYYHFIPYSIEFWFFFVACFKRKTAKKVFFF